MAEIVDRVKIWAGGERDALEWYRAQPLAALGGRTPESVFESGKTGALRVYLDTIALDGFA